MRIRKRTGVTLITQLGENRYVWRSLHSVLVHTNGVIEIRAAFKSAFDPEKQFVLELSKHHSVVAVLTDGLSKGE